MREKLSELLRDAKAHSRRYCDTHDICASCPYKPFGMYCRDVIQIDYLIGHGVTIQETKEEVE